MDFQLQANYKSSCFMKRSPNPKPKRLQLQEYPPNIAKHIIFLKYRSKYLKAKQKKADIFHFVISSAKNVSRGLINNKIIKYIFGFFFPSQFFFMAFLLASRFFNSSCLILWL